jgi:hypothetical protein
MPTLASEGKSTLHDRGWRLVNRRMNSNIDAVALHGAAKNVLSIVSCSFACCNRLGFSPAFLHSVRMCQRDIDRQQTPLSSLQNLCRFAQLRCDRREQRKILIGGSVLQRCFSTFRLSPCPWSFAVIVTDERGLRGRLTSSQYAQYHPKGISPVLHWPC